MSDYLIDIDKYLDGEMSEKEIIAFEEKVKTDAGLADALKLQKDMRSLYSDNDWIEGNREILKQEKAQKLKTFFTSEEADTLKNTISEVIAENRSSSGNKLVWWIGIAASIAILFGISTVVFKGNNYDDLYSEYLQVDDIPSLVTRGEEKEQLLQDAQILFDDQKYKEAIEVFTQYQNTADTINPLSYIYLGISYIEAGRFKEALNQFELLQNSNTLQSKKSDWYIVMVYLKQGKKNKLKTALQKILSDKNNYKYKEAQELLDVIE